MKSQDGGSQGESEEQAGKGWQQAELSTVLAIDSLAT